MSIPTLQELINKFQNPPDGVNLEKIYLHARLVASGEVTHSVSSKYGDSDILAYQTLAIIIQHVKNLSEKG